MHPVTVTMDRVFDVMRHHGQHGRFTEFGFVSAGKTHYSVRVPGWPVIESGISVTAVLGRPNDWHSVKGWLELSTGTIVAPARGRWAFMLVGGFLMTSVVSAQWRDASPFILFLLFALPCSFMLLRAERIRRTLRALIDPPS